MQSEGETGVFYLGGLFSIYSFNIFERCYNFTSSADIPMRPCLSVHEVDPQYFLLSVLMNFKVLKSLSAREFAHGSIIIHPIILRRFMYFNSPLMLLTIILFRTEDQFHWFSGCQFLQWLLSAFAILTLVRGDTVPPSCILPLVKANTYSKHKSLNYHKVWPENPQKAQLPIFTARCTVPIWGQNPQKWGRWPLHSIARPRPRLSISSGAQEDTDESGQPPALLFTWNTLYSTQYTMLTKSQVSMLLL